MTCLLYTSALLFALAFSYGWLRESFDRLSDPPPPEPWRRMLYRGMNNRRRRMVPDNGRRRRSADR